MDTHRFFTDAGHLNDLGTALYADGLTLGRSAEIPSDLLRHVATCDDCKQQIMDVAEVVSTAGIDRRAPHPTFDAARKERRSVPSWYRAAAVLALAVGIRTAYVAMEPADVFRPIAPSLTRSPGSDEHRTASPAAALPSVDRYRPSPLLESLLQTEFRSSLLEAVMPENRSTVQSPITFRWKHANGAVKIKILTNREVTVQTAIVRKGVFRTDKKFEPGLYYWKLEQNGELRHIGSFFIR